VIIFNYAANITIYLEKARYRSKAFLNADDHVDFTHYFKYFCLKQDNISNHTRWLLRKDHHLSSGKYEL